MKLKFTCQSLKTCRAVNNVVHAKNYYCVNPFQCVYNLGYYAITFGGVDVVITADSRVKEKYLCV